MSRRTIIYLRQSPSQTAATHAELRQTILDRGDTVVAVHIDDPSIQGKGRFRGWRIVIATLNTAEQVVVGSAADLPGRKVSDLLAILDLLRDHRVGLRLDQENIDTDDGASAFLDLIAAYRLAKRSEAIRDGQRKARLAGKRLGRPPVPDQVRRRIVAALASGGGVRPTAKRFGVCPATVINIRRSVINDEGRMAA